MGASTLGSRRRSLPAALVVAGFLLCGCSTFSKEAQGVRGGYGRADYAAAEALADARIAAETGAEEDLVTRSKALDPSIDPQKGDAVLYLLDKGMLRLAQGDSETAVRLFRAGRDTLDAHFLYDTDDLLKGLSAVVLDDTVRTYHGADYEHILVRGMLALADLAAGRGDAYAYAVQIGEKQEEIIGSPLGEVRGKQGYRPRERYRRVALGAYLQGIIREDVLDNDEAARAFERAVAFSGEETPLFKTALLRAKGEIHAPPDTGAVHVFYFGGRGPYLEETRQNPTADAVRLAGLAVLLMSGKFSLLAQAPVPVPQVRVNDASVPPLVVRSPSGEGATETILDVNRIASEELSANMPWIVARALVRRAAKAVVANAGGEILRHGGDRPAVALGGAVTLLAGIVSTAVENADTRSWATLPATLQALRLDLPAGEQTLEFDGGITQRLRVSPGRNTYVLVLRPALDKPPAILVDRNSLPPSP